MHKTQIVEELGESGLLLPALIETALQANDRAKLRMTALQDAAARARTPLAPFRSLDAEARAAGAGEDGLDALVKGARALEGGGTAVAGARRLVDGVLDDIALMIAPLAAAPPTGPDAEAFAARLAALRTAFSSVAADVLADAALARLTSARRGGDDSAHLLVMDLHKALNQLAASISVESVAGARTLGVREEDRPRIAAFMAGLDATRGLAFGHPGLDTTASRSGARLIIQNDIGTTDAHVIIVAVSGLTATVTYTDVHRSRAKFFVGLFTPFDAEWTPLAERSAAGLADGGRFHLVTGRYTARDEAGLDAFLAGVGGNLVFLIDWNKARKQLQTFVDKATAIHLLGEAARTRRGHRAFLELGGAELVFDAVRRSAEGRVPYGARLDRVLGQPAVARLLGEVLRLASAGLSNHRSVRLIRDEVRAELARSFGSAEEEILAVALRQLGIVRMLAAEVAAALDTIADFPEVARTVLRDRAKRLEEKGDRQVVAAREHATGPFGRGRRFLPVTDAAEEAADAFEEAAFLLSAARLEASAPAAGALRDLAEVAVACCSDMVRATAAACEGSAGRREDMSDALEAIDAVIEGERRADAAHRRVQEAALSPAAPDAGVRAEALVGTLELARALETGTDDLARAALALRASILEEVTQ
ncbi:hypothetical protein ABLE93_02540 [Xanthobacter sp. KR7-65]|uniref:hypothetical protein n=1 Tax=Xanthobacter sp. KR7-65 TaxID=3156612 RepID=UPI0032B43A63